MYSSIKKKRCKCGCGKMPSLSYDGWNYACAPDEIKEKVGNKKKQAQRRSYEKSKIRSLHSIPANKSMIEDKSALIEWFKYHAANSERKCENCGADLSSYNDADWRACQHHLIDKSPTNGCPSVAAVLENHGVLCKWGKGDAGGCHSLWHSSYETASKMPFFKIAKERFEKFKHLIAEEERRKIPSVFN